ncbi:MAG: hypothetical protein R3B48_24520 [Kofleriaceae bacterium]
MMRSRLLLALAVVAATATSVAAQPSDRQIKKDLTAKGTISIKLVGRGTVQANTDTLNYEYVRRAEIVRQSEYPGIKLRVIGDAVYQRVSRGRFTYWKFRVAENRYDGIPNPTPAEIEAILATDRVKQFGEGFANTIVKIVEEPTLAADPKWIWHDPKSVSFAMVAKVEQVASYTELETVAVTLDVRLYREDFKGKWTGFLVSPAKREPLGRTKYTADQISKMPRLAQQVAELEAKAAAAQRPSVSIPEFASAEDLARFVHRALREGPRAQTEAVLRALLAPSHYAPGSAVLLGNAGERLVTDALDHAFGAAATYAAQYCAEPVYETRGSQTHVAILGVKSNLVSEVAASKTGGKLVDGVEVGARWMLDGLKVRVRDDDQTREWIASFSDRKKLCPND